MPKKSSIKTIGELKRFGYEPVSVRAEMRRNLISMIKQGKDIFPGIIGYDTAVIPQIANAIISGQDIIFLGERGQAKSRIMRLMVNLLDKKIPVIKGCEIHDNPFAPICRQCRDKVAAQGDAVEIAWLSRQDRYGEKLATPDIVMTDLIGDIDPIKVAEGRYLSDELTIHYGLIPRTNRGIFGINELPDLTDRIQVGLFNLMEENDIQIRGYRVRLPLDIILVASANPEDYTSRGRIITPLKDRYGSQIRTHYPKTIEDEIRIMKMEHRQFLTDGPDTYVPRYMEQIIAQVTHLARKSVHINQSSGVSVRISIANYETLLSNAVRRAVILGEKLAVPRISDLPYIHSSTIGKIELESFDSIKENSVIDGLIRQAVLNVFNQYYQPHKLKEVVADFNGGLTVEVSDEMTARLYLKNTARIRGMADAVNEINSSENPETFASAVEFILEGLHLNKRLNKTKIESKMLYLR
jgi:magnesium chelatase subunit I